MEKIHTLKFWGYMKDAKSIMGGIFIAVPLWSDTYLTLQENLNTAEKIVSFISN